MRSLRILRVSQYSNLGSSVLLRSISILLSPETVRRFSNLIVKGDLGSSCLCFLTRNLCESTKVFNLCDSPSELLVLVRTVWSIRQVIQKEGHKMLEKMLEALFFILCCKML